MDGERVDDGLSGKAYFPVTFEPGAKNEHNDIWRLPRINSPGRQVSGRSGG